MKPHIINGDCVAELRQFNGRTDLIVTSPPYDALRTYDGFADAFDFENVAEAVVGALAPGGVLCWVVNDQSIDGDYTGTSFSQLLRFKELGLKFRQPLIFAKSGSGAPPHPDRYTTDIEFVWVMSKGQQRTFNPIIDKPNRWAGWKPFGASHRREANGALLPNDRKKATPKLSKRGAVWRYHVGHSYTEGDFDRAHEHPAIFPYKLASDLIRSYSNPGDLVIDPMCGSGTTLQAARYLRRRSVGIDVNPDYCELAESRLAQVMLVAVDELGAEPEPSTQDSLV